MRRLLIGLLVLGIAGLSVTPLQAQRGRGRFGQSPARNGWLSNYRAAKEQAKKTGKPLMVVIRCVP